MEYSTMLNEFIESICEQIRWKKAHSIISEEIRNHIIDQKDAFIDEGLDEDIAMEKAIKEMGDPVLIGTELDRTHRPKMEWNIFFGTGLMLIFGFAIRYLASFEGNTPFMLKKSLITTLIGFICMVIVYNIDFTFIGKYPKSIFIGLIILCIFSMLSSPIVKGKRLYIQFILLIFPTIMAGIIYNMRNRGYLGIILSGAFFIVPIFIGFSLQSMSIVVLLSLCFLILITMAIMKGWFNVNKLYGLLHIYVPVLSIVIVGFIKLMSYDYKRERFISIINPFRDPFGHGYVSGRMREMLVGARFIGRGDLGDNPYMIPAINTDYILTYLIHRLGWLAFMVVMGIIIFFIIRSFVLCYKQKSILGKLVSMAVWVTFTIEVIFYTITNLGLPIMGSLTLPFISYSGMSTIVNMILIGIMLSVFRSGDIVKDSQNISIITKSS